MRTAIIYAIFAIIIIVVGYTSKFFLWPDNPLEQFVEKQIENETGQTIDFSE